MEDFFVKQPAVKIIADFSLKNKLMQKIKT
jgi:hypothetical protein